MAATFRASGLVSGLDTNSIIDSLVAAESAPIAKVRAQQDAMKSKVSGLGALASRLAGLKTAVDSFATLGVSQNTVTSSASAFSAQVTSSASEGRYEVGVTALAAAGKARSQAFGPTATQVLGANLTLRVMGQDYQVTIADGSTLESAAEAINQSGANVVANVLSDGVNSYLSFSNRETGFPLAQTAADGLSITETLTGSTGQALNLAVTTQATNAAFTIDGLAFTRTKNSVSDALPGVNFSLNKKSFVVSGMVQTEELVIAQDSSATKEGLQKFVDAYNEVMAFVQKQLDVSANSNRQSTLSGDSVVRSLQQSLRALTSQVVPGLPTVRALADIGVKTNQDGSLTLDEVTLAKAQAREPGSFDKLFNQSATGLGAMFSSLVSTYTNSTDGLLVTRQQSLNKNVTALDSTVDNMQLRVDAYKQKLIAQFSAMETVVASLKSIGNFLSSQAASQENSK